jgi:tryptophan synthase beta chain
MSFQQTKTLRAGPDERGHFGAFGGRFVPETLMPLILELECAYAEVRKEPAFQQEMEGYLTNYIGRPSPLYFAERMTEHLKGAKIYFKRDELNHTGAHKVNNVLGQIMIARRMGRIGSSLKPAPACTASLPPHSAPALDSNVSSTWARSM